MSEEQKFKGGEIVQLKSGSPSMTVEWTNHNGYVECVWFEGYAVKRGNFVPESLELIQ